MIAEVLDRDHGEKPDIWALLVKQSCDRRDESRVVRIHDRKSADDMGRELKVAVTQAGNQCRDRLRGPGTKFSDGIDELCAVQRIAEITDSFDQCRNCDLGSLTDLAERRRRATRAVGPGLSPDRIRKGGHG